MPVPLHISPGCFTCTHGYGNRNRLWVREKVESEWICEMSRKERSGPLTLPVKGSKARPVKELQEMEHSKGSLVKLPKYVDSWNDRYFYYPQQLHLHQKLICYRSSDGSLYKSFGVLFVDIISQCPCFYYLRPVCTVNK